MLCRTPGCVAAQQCPTCLTELIASLAGVAQSRGETWARSVARRRPDLRDQPWPVDARSREVTRAKVADLSSDPRVAEGLVDQVLVGAVRAWAGSSQRK